MMALFISSALHCLAVFPVWKKAHSGTWMTLPGQILGKVETACSSRIPDPGVSTVGVFAWLWYYNYTSFKLWRES